MAILLSGLTIVISAGLPFGNQVLGALTLVLASLLPFAVPSAIYLIMGDQGKDLLTKTFRWMMAHGRALEAGTLLFFGAVSSGGGWAGCSSRIRF